MLCRPGVYDYGMLGLRGDDVFTADFSKDVVADLCDSVCVCVRRASVAVYTIYRCSHSDGDGKFKIASIAVWRAVPVRQAKQAPRKASVKVGD